MFKTITEVLDPNFLRLTSTQQAVLLNCFLAQTPEIAYEQLIGDTYTKTASDFIHRAGLVNIYDNSAKVTSAGFDYLLSIDLITESGESTENGQKISAEYQEQLKTIREAQETFRFLKTIA